jgi:Domain of unknown function (DUF4159)
MRAVAIALLLPALALADVDGEAVRKSIAGGVRAIKAMQLSDGRWPEKYHAGGETCLAALALLQAGESATSKPLAGAINYVLNLPDEHVYVVSLKIMLLAQADAQKHRRFIASAARWLIEAQQDNGLWSYTQRPGAFDHSNSQFALLGLHAAAEAGVQIPPGVWTKARNKLISTQARDGGWGYRGEESSYGSMTAAGVADMIILGSSVAAPQESGFRDGIAPNCGKYIGNRPLLSGLAWLGRNFSATQNPGRAGSYLHYWLYAVERCGILSGRRMLGRHDWYREGAAHLVKTQGPTGSWGGGLSDTAFAVLFLAKGRKPLLIQKLEWSADEAWNPDRHDVQNLVAFAGDTFGEPVEWQTVNLDAPLEEWLAAPLLYMQGHTFPNWGRGQRDKVRKYIEQGGTLLAEACCGSREFRTGFERFVREAFPDQPLRELDAGHPVYGAQFDLKPSGLMGLDIGCRTSVLYSPRDLSCLWEQGKIPVLSDAALKLGVNIAAFALGRQSLRDRLDVVTLPAEIVRAEEPIAAGALQLAQLAYDGDWRPDATALVHLAEFLRDELSMAVVTRYRTPRATDPDLPHCPLLYMTGHFSFQLSETERTALAAHLRRGGFLWADACCGRPAFDESMRALAARLFPGGQLKRLEPGHAIFRGNPGFRIDAVGYKPDVLREAPNRTDAELWGLEIDGRLALVYSPLAIGCGMDGHKCYQCRGLLDDDARRLAANVVLYALTH